MKSLKTMILPFIISFLIGIVSCSNKTSLYSEAELQELKPNDSIYFTRYGIGGAQLTKVKISYNDINKKVIGFYQTSMLDTTKNLVYYRYSELPK